MQDEIEGRKVLCYAVRREQRTSQDAGGNSSRSEVCKGKKGVSCCQVGLSQVRLQPSIAFVAVKQVAMRQLAMRQVAMRQVAMNKTSNVVSDCRAIGV